MIPRLTLEEMKRNIGGIDFDDDYFDDDLKMYEEVSREYLKKIVYPKQEEFLNDNFSKIFVLAMVNDLFTNRSRNVEENYKNNRILQSIVNMLRY